MRKSRDGREISAEDYSEGDGAGGRAGGRASANKWFIEWAERAGTAPPRHAGKIGVPQMRLNGGDATAPWLLHFLLPSHSPSLLAALALRSLATGRAALTSAYQRRASEAATATCETEIPAPKRREIMETGQLAS